MAYKLCEKHNMMYPEDKEGCGYCLLGQNTLTQNTKNKEVED